ncbi:MAG: S-layer homology domain-containing protein [Eubacteriales bacterium]|nr:S-layer homology domain-containing protein [Eubacteriales bacterium]
MKTKKLLAGVLAAATLVTSGATSALAVKQANFKDVSATAWYADAVSITYNHGMMNGTGGNAFTPNGKMDRAMVVQVLYNKAGKPAVDADKSAFSDVASTAWYYDAVQWAAKNNVASGVGDGKFAPNAAVTRQELASMLYRAEGSPKTTGNLGFKDATKVSSWAEKAMVWATQNKIINGAIQSDGLLLLNPTSTATRAEAAQMLAGYLNVAQKGHSYTSSVVKEPTAAADGVKRYTCSVCGHSYDEAIKAEPAAVLYNDTKLDGSVGTNVTDSFSSTPGNGTIIRTWYQNTAPVEAHVYLQKLNTTTNEFEDVVSFSVASGKDGWKEYTATDTDSATYRVRIYADSGKDVTGALRVVQTTAAAEK